jgi:peptidoglycan/xylan/chitin deacetylase (PgdA/CDA1 family)
MPPTHRARPAKRQLLARLIVLTGLLVAACGSPLPRPSSSARPPVLSSPAAQATPAPTQRSSAPSASPGSCSAACPAPAFFFHHGLRTGPGKVVALTFDDGFNIPACISIVHTLLAKGVTATFFPNGQYVRENPGFWHWVAGFGFPIGNHTTTHHDPTSLSAQDLGLNIESDRRIVDETTGLPSINAYRPPYGRSDPIVAQVAADAGYPLMVGWDVDSGDQTGTPTVAAEIANATKGKNGSIVLMHCGSALTPLALPAIIDFYASHGFSFTTVPQLLNLPDPAAGWSPPSGPDPGLVQQLGSGDSQPSWNGSPAFDHAGHLHLAYETPSGIAYGDDVAGNWQSATITLNSQSDFVSRPSIALDPQGGVDLVYVSSATTGSELMYRYRSSLGVWTSPQSVAKLAAPASTATITTDPSGEPVVAFALLAGSHAGIMLARPGPTGWTQMHVPTTNQSFIGPSIAIAQSGAIYLVVRRNGRSEVDLTTNESGTWTTSTLTAVPASAVPYAAFDPAGRLVVAIQPAFGGVISLGIGPPGGPFTWSVVTNAGDLSGLAIGPDGSPRVAFSRIARAAGPSRIWLSSAPPP